MPIPEPTPDVVTCSRVLLARARSYGDGKALVPIECVLDLLKAVERVDGLRPPLPPEFMSSKQVARMLQST